MTEHSTIGLRVMRMLQRISIEREEGQTLAEYAMILGLIAVVVIAVVALLGTTISSIFSSIAHGI